MHLIGSKIPYNAHDQNIAQQNKTEYSNNLRFLITNLRKRIIYVIYVYDQSKQIVFQSFIFPVYNQIINSFANIDFQMESLCFDNVIRQNKRIISCFGLKDLNFLQNLLILTHLFKILYK